MKNFYRQNTIIITKRSKTTYKSATNHQLNAIQSNDVAQIICNKLKYAFYPSNKSAIYNLLIHNTKF